MKKVPFEYFGAGQEIYFNIERLIQFESISKRPIGTVISTEALDITNLTILISVGLRHYGNKNPQYYAQELQRLIDAEECDIQDMQMDIVKALAGSGALGKEAKLLFFPDEFTKKEQEQIAEEARKN